MARLDDLCKSLRKNFNIFPDNTNISICVNPHEYMDIDDLFISFGEDFTRVYIQPKVIKENKNMDITNCFVPIPEYIKMEKDNLKERIKRLDTSPRLTIIQVGNNKASNTYIKGKIKDCKEVGIMVSQIKIEYPDGVDDDTVKSAIDEYTSLATDPVIVQLPLPKNIENEYNNSHWDVLSKNWDVDGFTPNSAFSPCTPKGVLDYLEYNKIDFRGLDCVVIGRSNIVGKPLTKMLIEKGATVTCCNSKTKDIKKYTKDADIVFAATGNANFFGEEYFGENQILIDVGINYDENGNLCGDIAQEAKNKALFATPVPGGVGLLTRLALLQNIISAYEELES